MIYHLQNGDLKFLKFVIVSPSASHTDYLILYMKTQLVST